MPPEDSDRCRKLSSHTHVKPEFRSVDAASFWIFTHVCTGYSLVQYPFTKVALCKHSTCQETVWHIWSSLVCKVYCGPYVVTKLETDINEARVKDYVQCSRYMHSSWLSCWSNTVSETRSSKVVKVPKLISMAIISSSWSNTFSERWILKVKMPKVVDGRSQCFVANRCQHISGT